MGNRYINHPILAIDANFQLHSIKKSMEENNSGLHTSLAFFVNYDKYIQHVQKYASQKDVHGLDWVVIQCVADRASRLVPVVGLAYAETKNTHGLRAMGVGICVCAGHEHVLPLAADDLQVGKR